MSIPVAVPVQHPPTHSYIQHAWSSLMTGVITHLMITRLNRHPELGVLSAMIARIARRSPRRHPWVNP